MGGQSRPIRCEVCDIACIALRYESSGFAQCERLVELLRGKFQDLRALRPCHRKDKVGFSGNSGRELSSGKVRRITTQLIEDARRGWVNWMPCQRVRTGTRCSEVLKMQRCAMCDGESLRRRRTTNISSAYEQYVQSKLLV